MQPGIAERCPSRACVPTLVGVRVGLLHSIDRAKPSLDGWSWLDQLRNVEADLDSASARVNRIEMSAERCLRGVCPNKHAIHCALDACMVLDHVTVECVIVQ
jgi:hypothetical protein